jgi:hypothetical protein
VVEAGEHSLTGDAGAGQSDREPRGIARGADQRRDVAIDRGRRAGGITERPIALGDLDGYIVALFRQQVGGAGINEAARPRT